MLRRDLFAPLPGEGRWHHVLLADGNIGIGGDPVPAAAPGRRGCCAPAAPCWSRPTRSRPRAGRGSVQVEQPPRGVAVAIAVGGGGLGHRCVGLAGDLGFRAGARYRGARCFVELSAPAAE